jgi:hypothetical protein
VATHAWPYAVSRDERSGYQAVVVPEFLADAGQAYVLEFASKGQASQPATVTVREVRGAVTEPLSLAYRVTEAHTDFDGPDGPDAGVAGRTMRVFEGLVLPVPAEQVASLGLTVEDLDAVADITAPALDKLRTAGTDLDAEPSTAISVGDMGQDAQLLDLQMAKPWVVPEPRDARPPEPAKADSGRRGLIIAAIIVCTLAALLAWYLIRLLPQSPAPIQASVRQWCSELRSGQADDVYRQFSNPYQQSTSFAVFESRLLGSGHSAICTSTATGAQRASLSLRGADGRYRTVDLDVQDQGGQWLITAMQVSS